MFEQKPHSTVIRLLLLTSVLLLLPHIGVLKPLFLAIGFGLIGWCTVAHFFERLRPNKWILLPLSVGLAFMVFTLHGMSLGREASSHLLIILLGLKLLESHTRRDVFAAILLSFFTVITPFLFEQTIPQALYSVVVFALLISALILNNMHAPKPLDIKPYRLGGMLLMFAVPLMVISFILFPRMTGPLWAMPDDSSHAISGISDKINPGNISRLALSEETAFKVQFDGKTPLHKDLYWRGPVFWDTDGQQWTLSPSKVMQQTEHASPEKETYHYTIIMPAHHQYWQYSLDAPLQAPEGLNLTTDHQILHKKKLKQAKAMTFQSQLGVPSSELSNTEMSKGLALPLNTDPRIFELAQQWRQKGETDAGVITAGLKHINTENFVYTLTPPQLGNDPVAEFLFNTQQGFCGHYATSFAVVLRAADIPTRLVAGYHGGLFNTVGGFWEIRQADAHVWVEAWIKGRGWLRIDPTAAVAPNRIQHSIDLDRQRSSGDVSFMLNPPEGFDLLKLQLNSIIHSIEYYWDSSILAYGPEVQGQFLSHFGIDGWRDMVFWLALIVGVLILIATLYVYRPHSSDHDDVQRAFISLCKKMARKAGQRWPSETSSDYFTRAKKYWPLLEQEITAVGQLYLDARYQRIQPERFIERATRLKKSL